MTVSVEESMAKKNLVKDQDKFIVRLPNGMRARIKAKAERAGISMNEAILWVLDREFPAPKTLDHRTEDLLRLVEAMKAGASADTIAYLADEIHTVLTEISEGKIAVTDEVRRGISVALEDWWMDQAERQRDEHERPWDVDEPGPSILRPLTGDTPPDDS